MRLIKRLCGWSLLRFVLSVFIIVALRRLDFELKAVCQPVCPVSRKEGVHQASGETVDNSNIRNSRNRGRIEAVSLVRTAAPPFSPAYRRTLPRHLTVQLAILPYRHTAAPDTLNIRLCMLSYRHTAAPATLRMLTPVTARATYPTATPR